jgi:predicted glycoside hydrolase/deacetylase ChbG (UPF0249 family)
MTDRRLVVVADDYGIGPGTSAGILRLCRAGRVSGTVLLVNSEYAEQAVRNWQAASPPADLGWHPALTLDAPVCDPASVPSLVDRSGKFHSLGGLMTRLMLGRVRPVDAYTEFSAQLQRFRKLTGHWPAVVNSHHHIQVFTVVGAALRAAMRDVGIRPYLRRVCEPWRTLARVPGAKAKRAFLSSLGKREARRQAIDGFPGNDWLAGITDPPCVHNPEFFDRWLRTTPGEVVELTCHPGDRDETLLGRDAKPGDGNIERRVAEAAALGSAPFQESVQRAGFCIVAPSEVIGQNRLRKAA